MIGDRSQIAGVGRTHTPTHTRAHTLEAQECRVTWNDLIALSTFFSECHTLWIRAVYCCSSISDSCIGFWNRLIFTPLLYLASNLASQLYLCPSVFHISEPIDQVGEFLTLFIDTETCRSYIQGSFLRACKCLLQLM